MQKAEYMKIKTLIWQFCSVICNSRIHKNQSTLIWQFCSVICNSRIHKNQNTLICSPAQSFAIAEYKQALRKCHFLIKVLPDMVQGQNRDHYKNTKIYHQFLLESFNMYINISIRQMKILHGKYNKQNILSTDTKGLA